MRRYDNLLVYHKIGSGKTCSAIRICENLKDKYKIIFVCPASLIPNMYGEIISGCSQQVYYNDKEMSILKTKKKDSKEYLSTLEQIYKRIDKVYKIISINKFTQLRDIDLSKTVLIIDEIQNMISTNGNYYKYIKELINERATKTTKIILMTATPIFDKPIELALTMNLLRPKEEYDIDNFYKDYIDKSKVINIDNFMQNLQGKVSYYKGAPEDTYPIKKEKIIKCIMSDYQTKCYKEIEVNEKLSDKNNIYNLPANFLLGLRTISNIAFPNKLIKENGYNELQNSHLDNLEKYSCKMARLIYKITSNKGLHFVYSSFRSFAGIETIIKLLEFHGYKNVLKEGEGKKRYAIWSGEETLREKTFIKNLFNEVNNVDGSNIKVILGSPAIKEGVSLLRVKYVHILEPYWNVSRYLQVIGRAFRFCSHKDLPIEERIVKVLQYVAIIVDKNKTITVDQYILDIAKYKQKINDKFDKILQEVSINKLLF